MKTDDVVLACRTAARPTRFCACSRAFIAGCALDCPNRLPRLALGLAADLRLDCHVSEEACPLNLVTPPARPPWLALGDALAMTLLLRKDFSRRTLRISSGGKLGKRFLRIEQLMHRGTQIRL